MSCLQVIVPYQLIQMLGTFAYLAWCLENWAPSVLDWMMKRILERDEMRQGEDKPPGLLYETWLIRIRRQLVQSDGC